MGLGTVYRCETRSPTARLPAAAAYASKRVKGAKCSRTGRQQLPVHAVGLGQSGAVRRAHAAQAGCRPPAAQHHAGQAKWVTLRGRNPFGVRQPRMGRPTEGCCWRRCGGRVARCQIGMAPGASRCRGRSPAPAGSRCRPRHPPAMPPAATGCSGFHARRPCASSGQVYSYIKDGVRHYTSKRPKGVASVASLRTIKLQLHRNLFRLRARQCRA